MGIKVKGGSTAGTPPKFETGMVDARFDGVTADVIEKSQFDPKVFIWSFTLLDDDGDVLYDEGEPVTVDKVTSRSTNTGSKTTPGAVKVLKALMTEKEFKAFENEEEQDSGDLQGRNVQLVIERKDNGWPLVGDVLPARKARRNS